MEEKNLLSILPSQDKQLIHSYMAYCGGRRGDTTSPVHNIDYFLRFWDQNKGDMFNLLGGELIKTVKVAITKTKEEMYDDLVENLKEAGSAGKPFIDNFNDFIYSYAWEDLVAPQTETTKNIYLGRRNTASYLNRLVMLDPLMNNVYDDFSFKIVCRNGVDVIDVNNGCKVSKILGKLAKEFDIKGYEEFRVAHSMCLNQKILKGEVCFSIHPLDYMTMSDNGYNWTSCMSWREGGDYRLGTIEMMNSPFVVVAYLKGNKPWECCYNSSLDTHWSNKRWRELFIVNPNIILGIKDYPYHNEEMESVCLSYLKDWAGKNLHWGPYTENLNQVVNRGTSVIGEAGKSVYMDIQSDYMYCDVYDERLAYVALDIPKNYYLNYSGEAVCVECGERIWSGDDRIDPSLMLCDECNPYRRCDECGDDYDKEEMVCVDDYYFCPYCAERMVSQCEICEEVHIIDRIEKIYLAVAGKRLGPYVCVCEDCREKIINAFQGKVSDASDYWSYYQICNFEDLDPQYIKQAMEWFQLDKEDIKSYREKIAAKNSAETDGN